MIKVIVEDNNPLWAGMFETEAKKLRDVFGEELTVVHHIGSTSVPGLKAKPIIDWIFWYGRAINTLELDPYQ